MPFLSSELHGENNIQYLLLEPILMLLILTFISESHNTGCISYSSTADYVRNSI